MGLQGAQTGLQGVGQAINAGQLGLQGAGVGLQGTAQGMQGAQTGLQGVQGAQAGYGLANQSAATLGSLGAQQLGAQTDILKLQDQIGGQQQALEQSAINQAISNYAQGQNAPIDALQQFSGLLHGYAVPGTTATTYQATPSAAAQLGSLGLGAYGLGQLVGKKRGGTVKSGTGIDTIALRRALAGA